MKLSKSLIIAVSITVLFAMCGTPAFAASKAPAKVTGVKVTKATNTAISLSWKKAARAKTYEVKYKASGTKKWKTSKTKARKITVKKLKENKKYSFKLRAVNGKKKGKYSKTITQKTFATPGKIEQNSLFASQRTKKNISLSWKAVANAQYYEIDAHVLNGPAFGLQHSIKPSYETVHQTRPNTWYKYRVRGVNTKTGKFPVVHGPWSDYFYTCTTSGDRVIKGSKKSDGTLLYQMSGAKPFCVGEDDSLVPTGYIDKTDEYGPNFVCDTLGCTSVQFPGDYPESKVAGKIIKVGSSFDGVKIASISVEQAFDEDGPSGGYVVALHYENNSTDYFSW